MFSYARQRNMHRKVPFPMHIQLAAPITKNGHPCGWPFVVEASVEKLPDASPVLGFHVLGVAFLDVERCVPRIDVAERREGADLTGGMRVGHDLLAHRI